MEKVFEKDSPNMEILEIKINKKTDDLKEEE